MSYWLSWSFVFLVGIHPAVLLIFFWIVFHVLIPGIIVCNLIPVSTQVAYYFAFFPGCHSPPVSDKELIAIIKAFNAAKHNPAAKLIWQCSTCTKIKNAVVIDVDDDDDEIIALDGPPTNPEVDTPQLSTSFTHSKRRSSNNAASYDHIQPPGRTSGTKDKQIRIIDDPFIVPDIRVTPPPSKPPQTSSSTKPSEFVDLTISNDGSDGSDDALEYVTPAPTSKPAVEIVHELPQTLTSNDLNQDYPSPKDVRSTAQTQLLNHLLTRWLNDRHTSVGPDIWARACLRRDQDAAKRRSLGSKSASIALPSRRKFKPHNLSERSRTHSRATVFLSAEEWLHEKQARLLLE